MQRRRCLVKVFAETSHLEEDSSRGEFRRTSHTEGDLFSGGA